MLTEFAMTFDVLRHGDCGRKSQDHLRDLANGIFPRGGTSAVILANLYGGRWFDEAINEVKGIKNQTARLDAEKFLKKLKEILVNRPEIGNPPRDEKSWVNEAMAASQKEPISRIVASAQVCTHLRAVFPSLKSLEDAATEAFWEGIAPNRSVGNRLPEQIDALRSICVHAGFIAFASPEIYGGVDDETDFVVELIRSALDRPTGFPLPTIHIHTEGSEKFENRYNRMTNICQCLQSASSGHPRISLFVWRKLLERVLLAGDHALDPGRPHGPRWGVSFSHVARVRDKPDAWRPTFALLDKEGKAFWLRTLYTGGRQELLEWCVANAGPKGSEQERRP